LSYDQKKDLIRWAQEEADKATTGAVFSGENEAADNALSEEDLIRYQEIQDAAKRRDYAKLEEMRGQAVQEIAPVVPPAQPVTSQAQSPTVVPSQPTDGKITTENPADRIAELEDILKSMPKGADPSITDTIKNELAGLRAVQTQPSTKPGATSRVATSSGLNVDTRFKLMDAGNLITSNTDAFGINEAYPQELQPRQRNRTASQQQIESIISNLNPELLGDSPLASDGAPIIGPDNVVESGNGRVARSTRKSFSATGR
jgi:hypothetical protein